MTRELDWNTLRPTLRRCAIATLVVFAFLAVWQVLIPGGEGSSSGVTTWALLLLGAACLSLGPGLAASASRRLWRAERHAVAFVPAGFLLAASVAFPGILNALGASGDMAAGSLLLAWLCSAGLSAYLIVSTASAEPASPAPDLESDFTKDEPHAYARDVERSRKGD